MPRFLTCLKQMTPTLLKGGNKDNPAEFKTKAPIENLTVTIESQSDRPVPGTGQLPRRDSEDPGGGLHVYFRNGMFSMPYPFHHTNAEAQVIDKELGKKSPPMTIHQAQRVYKFLVENESGLLGIDYQLDPSDDHWTTVDPQLKPPDVDAESESDKKAKQLEDEAMSSAAKNPMKSKKTA